MSSSSALDGNNVKMFNHLCSTDHSEKPALLKGTEGIQAKQNRKEKELKEIQTRCNER